MIGKELEQCYNCDEMYEWVDRDWETPSPL